ncbi:AraC family transcriptional regulator [Paenibacillus allorhizosphaerae]|uniref:HTH-type transcriptional activator RhaR n=1 Tax=Paenibacillus allorhizosphaerae TaxID=2849866 RepID=A0ABM8VEK5_9BACL|nr:AraC family transcriptional regulator [Paenibacillus allorhizosphaerae]CAG7631732.1 HTH-type transcriptional activator RhaR [Paenibacillus allorhizosphaerae]
MDCLQLLIPPLPQFLTAGHSVWRPGMRHFPRTFDVYDLLIVCSGTLYMSEEDQEYEISGSGMLLLEPGRAHIGYRPCTEPTEIYWLHFSHSPAVQRLPEKSVAWSAVVRQGTDSDQSPVDQYLYLPKHGPVELNPLLPMLEEMLRLRSSLTMEHAIDLQVLLGKLLTQLQSGLRGNRRGSRSLAVADQVKRYLESRLAEPYRAERMAEALHFDVDYAARCLRKHTGLSPLQYHHVIRMEEAKRLLRQTGLPVQAVAAQVGYADYNYFIRLFRKTVGASPGVYRHAASGYV